MTAVEEVSAIPIEILIEYYRAGFKLIPLSKDAKNPNVQGLLTPEEEVRSRQESADGQIHPVNFIYNHPEFWIEDRIRQEYWRFSNVATTFGRTHINDDQGRPLYLNGLDIDSKPVFDELAIIKIRDEDHYFIDDMCKTTFVTKTRKKWGLHIYWLSHDQHQPLRSKDFKPSFESEIKTDNSGGLITLPTSVHRDDPNFHYQSVGSKIISVQDELYKGLLRVLKDCIRQEKLHSERNTHDRYTESSPNKYSRNRIPLTASEIEDIVTALTTVYRKNSRHSIVYGLSGYLCKSNIALDSARKVIAALCQTTGDEESKSRMNVLDATYNKARNGEQIVGYTNLRMC